MDFFFLLELIGNVYVWKVKEKEIIVYLRYEFLGIFLKNNKLWGFVVEN